VSWDATLHCTACHCSASDWNYTHNCNPMITMALAQSGTLIEMSWWKVLDGMSAPTGAKFLTDIIVELDSNPARYRAMDPPNEWGSYDTLLPVLREMLRASLTEVPSVWRVSG